MAVSMAEATSLYAGVVSSILGLIQITEWRRRSRYLHVSVEKYWNEADDWRFEVHIENRGIHPTKLKYVALTVYQRRRWRPWEKNPLAQCSFGELSEDDPNVDVKQFDKRVLVPGDSVEGVIPSAMFRSVRPGDWYNTKRFYPYCIWIEHSQSSSPTTLRLRGYQEGAR